MTKISGLIITFNEESHIESCIKSLLTVCDDVVVVDSFSTDRTAEIARSLGATVISQEWLGFGPQKRFAVDNAQTDWVLCLDADEFLSEELSKSVQDLFVKGPECDAYRFARSNKFLGKYLRHGEGYPDWSLRLFNRKKAQWSADRVHEKVIPLNEGELSIGKLSGDLMHNSGESLAKYIQKQNEYTDIQAEKIAQNKKSISVFNVMCSPLIRFH